MNEFILEDMHSIFSALVPKASQPGNIGTNSTFIIFRGLVSSGSEEVVTAGVGVSITGKSVGAICVSTSGSVFGFTSKTVVCTGLDRKSTRLNSSHVKI